jgi:hypothetical protein
MAELSITPNDKHESITGAHSTEAEMIDNLFGHLCDANPDGWINQLESLAFTNEVHPDKLPRHVYRHYRFFFHIFDVYMERVRKSKLHIKTLSIDSLGCEAKPWAECLVSRAIKPTFLAT